jgi:hypothetical protein
LNVDSSRQVKSAERRLFREDDVPRQLTEGD